MGGNGDDGAGGDGDGDGDGGDNGDVTTTSPIPTISSQLDDDVALSADNFPNATEADFAGRRWKLDARRLSAIRLQPLRRSRILRRHHDPRSARTRAISRFRTNSFMSGFDEVAPGSSETVRLFERDGHLSAFGFVSMAMLEYLRMRYTGIDLSNLDVSVPGRGEPCRAAAPASRLRFRPARRRRRSAQVLHPGRRSGPDLTLLRFRLDARHRTGDQHENRQRAASIAQLHDARVPAHARRRAGLHVRLLRRRRHRQRHGPRPSPRRSTAPAVRNCGRIRARCPLRQSAS